LIGFEKQVEQRPLRSFLSDFGGVMPSPKERERSRASLQREAPVSDEATLLVLQEQIIFASQNAVTPPNLMSWPRTCCMFLPATIFGMFKKNCGAKAHFDA
jgi:hypothetical protein